MKFLFNTVLILLASAFLISCQNSERKEKTKEESEKPNIIYILADDLGYNELGAYGQKKIETPNIDALAKEGMMFTQHYTSAPVCAPARYSLLTGKHSGNSYIRGNNEWPERGDVWNYLKMAKDSTLEGQHPVPKETRTIANMLQEKGYKTGMIGKWGMGAPHTHSIPTKMGFDFFFGYNCQRQAHTYYPLHLYKNEQRVHLNNDTVAPGTKLPAGANPYDDESYAKYDLNEYAPSLMFDEITTFVDKNINDPFFLYWASPIPHSPLQAPTDWVEHYKKKFGEEEPFLGDRAYFPNRNPRATYAAMISYLDENIGKLVQQLKENGQYENTLIIFTSDNGPASSGTDSPWFKSAAPFKTKNGYVKGHLNEGGIRIPMIASWPGRIKANSKTDLISAHYDVMATFGDLINSDVPPDTDGISFLPTLLGKDKQKEHEFLFWAFPGYGGQIAIRMGEWKVLRKNLKNEEKPTLELYNLTNDPQEMNNLADGYPEIIKKAARIFEKEYQDAEVENFNIPAIENGKGLLGNQFKS